MSAPKYVEYLMEWIETQLDDESIFPQKLGKQPFAVKQQELLDLRSSLFLISSWLYRSSISIKFSRCCEDNFQEAVSCICSYLPLAFSEDCEFKGRSSSKHLL